MGITTYCNKPLVDRLFTAVEVNEVEKVARLLKENPELVMARDMWYATPLHFATSVDMARCLLEHGVIDDTDDEADGSYGEYAWEKARRHGKNDVADLIRIYKPKR